VGGDVMKIIKLIILFFFICPIVRCQAIGPFPGVTHSSGVTPGLGWTDLVGQQIAPNCPPNPGTNGSCYGTVEAWNGAVGDTTRNRMCLPGDGGHNDYQGNEIYCLDMNTLTISRLSDPSNPTPRCSLAYSDGRSSSRHEYGGSTYIPTTDRIFRWGGVWDCAAGGFQNDTWEINPAAITLGSSGLSGWSQINNGSVSPTPCAGSGNPQTAYDPNNNVVWVNENCTTGGLWSYNPTTKVYTQRLNAANNLTVHQQIVLDPSRKVIMRFGDGGAQKIDISNMASPVMTSVTGCAALNSEVAPGLAYDSSNQLIVGWPNFGNTVWLYNATTDTCSSLTFPNGPTDSHHTGSPSTTNGTYGRFQYFPSCDCFALINDWDLDAFTLKISSSNADMDFSTRCGASGVVRCVAFNSSSDLTGTSLPGSGLKVNPASQDGITVPTIDNTVFHSGNGSMQFIIPSTCTSADCSGSYNINFTDTGFTQMDSLINGDPLSLTTACGGSPCGNEFYISWMQRWDAGAIQNFPNGNGFKQAIVGEGDYSGVTASSCSDIETPVENSSQMGIIRMYHSCGQKLSTYEPLTTYTGLTDTHGNGIFSPENQAGGYLNCTYAATINVPTVPPCIPYAANKWFAFLYHIKLGTWFPAGGAGGTFKHDSTVELYVQTSTGGPWTKIISYVPGATSPGCDNTQVSIPSCLTGYDLANPTAYPPGCITGSTCQPDGDGHNVREKFGKIWFLPYTTNRTGCTATGGNCGHTWYDELIISKSIINPPQF
jgi:hypothetical protein